jgi:3-oxoacyl-[acyl-carrier-protein] synthase-3
MSYCCFNFISFYSYLFGGVSVKKSAGIIGWGHYVPEPKVTNEELARRFGITEDSVEKKAGIIERRIAENDVATSDMAVIASQLALEKAKILPSEIDLIIVATTTPDMVMPSTACLVQHSIGAENAAAFDVSAACTGFVYALDIAESYVAFGKYENALVIGADTYSRITNSEDINTSVLFGDGAGAVVVGAVPEGYGIRCSLLGADGSISDSLKVPAGGSRTPLTHDLLDRRLNTIVMNGRDVFEFAVGILEKTIYAVIDKMEITLSDLSLIIPHQANKRILLNVSKNMGIPFENIYCNIEQYGNMSSASIPVALTEACGDGSIKENDLVLLAGFGAGMTWGASLIKWNRIA